MKNILMLGLPAIILGIIALAIYYMSIRIAWAFELHKIITLAIVASVSICSFISMILIMRGNYTSSASHIISNTSNIIIGILMFAVCSMLLLDLINIIVKIQPLTYGLTTIALTLLITTYSLYNAIDTKIYHQTIKLPNLENPLRIAHLSDIHFGHFWGERYAKRLISLIQKEEVDMVVITGDMFDGRVRLKDKIMKPFEQLNVPIYFAEGNHDGYSGSSDIKQLLTKHGIKVLSNEKAELNGLQIVGLNYLLPDNNSADTFNGALSSATMQNTLPKLDIDPTRASILLHHNPVGANYAAENGINLYLAGHTHAGQLFPATIFASIMFKYNKGLYKYDDNMQIYVSQGTGTFGPPMRLGTHSELTIIELK